MKFDKKQIRRAMSLYAVTDRTWLNGRSLYECVEQSLKGGATFVQLREKNIDFNSFADEAAEIKTLCQKYHVPFVINDNVELAKLIDADGVHIGQSDMALSNAKKILGDDKIIGVSATNLEQALKAQNDGASYIGVGSVFPTETKKDACNVDFETLKEICSQVSIPVVAIGGIKSDNVESLYQSGIDGVAVVSAIFASDDIESATKKLKAKCKKELFDFPKHLVREKLDEILKFHHAIFDLDGTLIDSMYIWHDAADIFVKQCGVQPKEELGVKLFNQSLLNGARIIKDEYLPNLTLSQILDGVENVVHDAYKTSIPLKGGAKEFLEVLKNHNINCAIATSNDVKLVQIALERLEISEYFEKIFTCSDFDCSKDDATLYLKAAEFLGGSEKDTLVFEDALMPVQSAKSAGFTVVAIKDEESRENQHDIQKTADYFFDEY